MFAKRHLSNQSNSHKIQSYIVILYFVKKAQFVMKIISLIALLVFGIFNTPAKFYKVQSKNADKERAGKLIVHLKKGALLVQLLSKQSTIDAYIKKGYPSIAEDIKQKQLRDNLKIMAAFKESFRFCKVYFFLSEQIDALEENRINDVVFVNAEGLNDPEIDMSESFYMTASYAKETDKNNKSLLSVNALTIKDNEYKAVKRYFPNYLKIPEDLPRYKKLKKKIYNYDKELRTFYYRQPV